MHHAPIQTESKKASEEVGIIPDRPQSDEGTLALAVTEAQPSRHTKGPWAIDAGFLVTKGYAGGVGVPMLELNGRCAQCDEPTGWITGGPEQWEADAALISAAPELLLVARMSLALFENSDLAPGVNVAPLIKYDRMLRAAIAKAEGRDQ